MLIREECDSECISKMPKAYDVWNDLVRLEKPGHVMLLLCITYTLGVWRCLNNSIQPCRTQLFHCHQKKNKQKKDEPLWGWRYTEKEIGLRPAQGVHTYQLRSWCSPQPPGSQWWGCSRRLSSRSLTSRLPNMPHAARVTSLIMEGESVTVEADRNLMSPQWPGKDNNGAEVWLAFSVRFFTK